MYMRNIKDFDSTAYSASVCVEFCHTNFVDHALFKNQFPAFYRFLTVRGVSRHPY